MILDNFFPSVVAREEHTDWANKMLPIVNQFFQDNSANESFYYNGKTTHGMGVDLIKNPQFKPFTDFIIAKGHEFLTIQGFDTSPLKLNPYFFLNSFQKGSSHPKHVHSQCTLSGIFYLQTPPGSSKIRFYPNQPFRDFFDYFFHVKDPNNWFALSHYEYDPYPGLLLIWPGWLYHEVPPNNSEEPRISIVFNL